MNQKNSVSSKSEIISRYKEDLTRLFSSNRFVVFLCGPTLKNTSNEGVKLRKQIKEKLEAEKFEVILGEDDGLEDARLQLGADAQTNEMLFIEKKCNAIVLIASSVGAYCELGLFSEYVGRSDNKIDFMLIISNRHEGKKSYLNHGPATVVKNISGMVYYEDLEAFDPTVIIDRLKKRRAFYTLDSRGRPRGGAKE